MTPTKDVEFVLRELLKTGTISTHEDIVQALSCQGYTVNQSKISRLLHKIGAVKVTNEQGQATYRLPHEHVLLHEINMPTTRLSAKLMVIDITHNSYLIVIHTTPGAANLVAREIDLRRKSLHILGTIAGDDTVFVVPKDIQYINEVVEQVKETL